MSKEEKALLVGILQSLHQSNEALWEEKMSQVGQDKPAVQRLKGNLEKVGRLIEAFDRSNP